MAKPRKKINHKFVKKELTKINSRDFREAYLGHFDFHEETKRLKK
jgi:hypothetical protein